jgi:hypothetical protein
MLLALAAGSLVLWQAGVHVDIWSHIHQGFAIETFFTWSHALLYGGWASAGLVVVAHQFATRAPLPRSYRTYLLGVALFGFGGAFDFIWHGLFGFEANQAAVLSPAHLWLAVAFTVAAVGLLDAAAHRRASTADNGSALRLIDVPLVLSLGMLLRVTTWYATYADPLTIDFAAGGVTAGGLPGYVGIAWDGMTAQVAGTTGIFLRGVILALFLVGPLRLLRLPSGSIVLMMLYEALLIVLATDQWPALFSVAGAALAGEAVWGWMRKGGLGGLDGTTGYWVLGGIVPLVQTSLGLALTGAAGGTMVWSIHLWTGVPVTVGILGLSVAVLAVPPAFLRGLTSGR